MANCEDQDKVAHYKPTHLTLHCLQIQLFCPGNLSFNFSIQSLLPLILWFHNRMYYLHSRPKLAEILRLSFFILLIPFSLPENIHQTDS